MSATVGAIARERRCRLAPELAGLATACLLSAAIGCAGSASAPQRAPAATVHDYYPLRPGSAWSYDVDAGDGAPVLAIARVTAAQGDAVQVRTGAGLVAYRLVADGIVRAQDGSYLLRAPLVAGARWPSLGGADAQVERVGLTIDVPAGRFEGCVRVIEPGSRPRGQIATVYCPGVGPVEVVSSVQLTATTARVVARLRGFVVGAER